MPSADLDNVLYWNELDSSDSRYDRTRAGPSDQGLVVMWSIYSPLLFLFSGFVLIVFLGILTNPKVRKNPFNKYILFLSFPDFLYSFLCAITCLASALNGGYSSWEMCQFQVFYLNFGAAANSWLNGVMAYEIYVLLRSSRVRRRYFPPSDQKVYITSSLCYLIALIGAGISLLGSRVDWLSSPGIQAGFVCTVNEDTWQHTLTFWLLTAPLLFALPYAFASYVFYDVIIGSKLLPPRGKRRELSIYFFRIGAMFLFLWMPTIAIMYIFRGMSSPWVTWGLGLFSHTQGVVSASLTLMKEDVRDAVCDFCRRLVCLPPRNAVYDPSESSSFSKFKLWSSGFRSSRLNASNNLQPTNAHNNSGDETQKKGQQQQQDRRSVDAFGLPLQDSDFQFLDETTLDQDDGAEQSHDIMHDVEKSAIERSQQDQQPEPVRDDEDDAEMLATIVGRLARQAN